jgi:hypothetical protein
MRINFINIFKCFLDEIEYDLLKKITVYFERKEYNTTEGVG